MAVEQRLRRLNKRSYYLIIVAVALGLAAALFLVGQAILISAVISRVFLGGALRSAVAPLLALILLFILARSVLIWLQEIIAQRSAGHLKSDLRLRLTAHLLRLGPAYTVGERSGELVNTAVSAIETLDAYMTQFIPARYLAAIVPTLVFLIILIIDPWTSLVLVFAGPMLILILALIGGRTKAITERRFVEMSWMSAFFLDMLQGLETLKIFGRSREQVGNIREISSQYGSTTMDILRTAFQTSLVMEWAAVAATAMVALEVSLRMMNGHITYFQALAVLLLTPEFFLPLRQMSLRYHAGTAGKTAAARVFAVLDTQPAGQPPSTVEQPARIAANGRQPPQALSGAIRFDDVYASYTGGQRPALNGVSFTIAPGEKIALVGPTGAGKSTIAGLLLRFIAPDSGQITVGGTPIADLSLDAWRTQIAYVPQNPHLFHGSVADNLRLASPGATQDELVAASRAAHAHEFILALPNGYDTPIGEGGLRLSGGQRQRLAIARAYLKGAPVIILDEPTANLDLQSEALVRDSLTHLVQGRTLLLVTHRLQMVQDVDRVLVIANGRIAARQPSGMSPTRDQQGNGSAAGQAGGAP